MQDFSLLEKIENFSTRVPHLLACIFLSFMTLALYLPTIHYGFVFDDFPTILEYPHFHTSEWFTVFFSSSRWVARLLHRIGFLIGGYEPYGYRLVNLFLHLATGLLVYALMYLVCKQLKQRWFSQRSKTIAFFSAALFLLHPAQTQTATYMTQMGTEGVAAFFAVAVCLLFTCALLSVNIIKKTVWIFLMLALAYVGCGTKEIIVVLPGLVFLIDLVLLAQGNWGILFKRILIHVALAITMFFGLNRVGMRVNRVIKEAPHVELPNNRGNIVTQSFTETIKPNLYRWSQPKILWHYLSIFIVPIGLCFEYPTKIVSSPTDIEVLIPLAFWLFLISILFFCFIKKKLLPIVFGFSWFLAVMLPRAVTPSQELVCDYKTYIASVGIMFILAIVFLFVLERVTLLLENHLRNAIKSGGIISFILLAMTASHMRNYVWSNEQFFWQDVVAKVPDRARAYNNLAVAFLVKNDATKAVEFFEKAIEKDNFYAEPHVNLALIAQRQKDFKKAAHHYDRALEIGEQHPQLFYNLGIFNTMCGDLPLAEKAYRRALEIRSHYPPARYELARLLEKQKKYEELVRLCEETFQEKAVGEYPFAAIYANSLFEKGDYVKALNILRTFNPKDPKIAFMVGYCLYQENKYDEAIKYFEIAHNFNRHDISIAYNFGQALMRAAKYEQALDVFGRCNNVVDQLPYVPFFKACCLNGLGRVNESREVLSSVIKTTKDSLVKHDAQVLLKTI